MCIYSGLYLLGEYCQTDVNECDNNPCKNDAACTNSDGDYMCNCTIGYEGKNCDQPDCDAVNCQNEAACKVNLTAQQWTCVCPQYYEGMLSTRDFNLVVVKL